MPIALLLGTATIYPRLGAGARTAWALTIGPFGVAMGASEAGYYTLATSASGDDLPGLLTITAGLTLIAIGTITLRTTRRMETAWPVATYADVLLASSGVAAAYLLLSGRGGGVGIRRAGAAGSRASRG